MKGKQGLSTLKPERILEEYWPVDIANFCTCEGEFLKCRSNTLVLLKKISIRLGQISSQKNPFKELKTLPNIFFDNQN